MSNSSEKVRKILLVVKPTPQVPSQASESTRRQHVATVSLVKSVLAEAGIAFDTVVRGKKNSGNIVLDQDHDLVITVGGDGTFLDASHSIRSSNQTPLFGVNSAPESSFGNYCNASAKNFQIMLDRVLSGKEYCHSVARLMLTLDGKRLWVPVLNEVLVTGSNSASTCRYDLHVGGEFSSQKSSGLVVATPTGTTGLFHSAGGTVIPLNASQFAYQVLARFGLPDDREKLNSGFVPFANTLKVESKMSNGKLFVDGPHIEFSFKRDSVLEVAIDPNPLRAYVSSYRHHDYDPYQILCSKLGGQAIG